MIIIKNLSSRLRKFGYSGKNISLICHIENGKFRTDLFHRLNEIKIYIEPLRNRPEDIPPLIDYFTKKYHSHLNRKPLRALSKDIVEKLINYHWPGNVRELQNVLKRIIVLDDSEDSIDAMLKDRGGETPDVSVETLINRVDATIY